MEHNSSFNKQLRREITGRAEINKKIKMLKSDIDVNNKKIYDVDKEIRRVIKLIPKRKQKNRNYTDLSLRLIELKKSKTDLRNKIDAFNQIISHIEDVKEQAKRKIKQLKNKIKNLPKENPFDFTGIVKKDDEIDLGLFLELAEENKIIYNQLPINTLVEDMEKLTNGFFTNGYITLGDNGEIDIIDFSKTVMN